MKLNKTEKKEKSIVELEVAVLKDEFEAAIEKAYRKNAKNIAIPGFRKGKAPRKLIEQMYGKGVFYEDAINESYPAAYDEAVKEAGLDVVGRAEVDIKEIDENGNGYTFIAKVPVRPEITLGKYTGLSAEKSDVNVSDEQVDREIENLRKRVATYKDCTEPLKMGDTAVIDFEGFIDGVPFEGGKGENHPLILGSGSFIPGFEEQLVGAKVGDAVDVKVTFPEEYHAAELAGKPAVFKCTIRAGKEILLPELNDEFAKDVSEHETFAALKEDVQKGLLEEAERVSANDFEEKILDQIIETMEGEIPQAMYDSKLDRMLEEYSYKLQLQGIDMETYLKANNMDMQSFRMIFMPQAERQVKVALILRKVAELEKIEVSDDEVNAEYKKLAEAYNMDEEKVKKLTPADIIKEDLAMSKALDFIREHSKAVKPKAAKKTKEKAAETDAETEKPAKKKAPAKKTTEKKETAAKKTTKKEAASK